MPSKATRLPCPRGLQDLAGLHDACLDQLFVEPAHSREQLGRGHEAASESAVAFTRTIARILISSHPNIHGRSLIRQNHPRRSGAARSAVIGTCA